MNGYQMVILMPLSPYRDFVVPTVSPASQAQMLYSDFCTQELAFWCWVVAHRPASAGLDGLQQKRHQGSWLLNIGQWNKQPESQ